MSMSMSISVEPFRSARTTFRAFNPSTRTNLSFFTIFCSFSFSVLISKKDIFLLKIFFPSPCPFFLLCQLVIFLLQIFSSFSFSIFLLLDKSQNYYSKYCLSIRTSMRDLHCLNGLVVFLLWMQINLALILI